MLLQDSEQITEKYKKRKQVVRQIRKEQEILSLMLILQAMDQFPKYKQDVYKTITFVSNVDVQAFITLSQ